MESISKLEPTMAISCYCGFYLLQHLNTKLGTIAMTNMAEVIKIYNNIGNIAISTHCKLLIPNSKQFS